jgi:hypothetical protein
MSRSSTFILLVHAFAIYFQLYSKLVWGQASPSFSCMHQKGKVKDHQGRKEEGNSFPMKRMSRNPLTWNPKDWEHVEIMSFIRAKCDELFANLDFVDPWNQFETTTIKWHKIAKVVMQFISHFQWACMLVKTSGACFMVISKWFTTICKGIGHKKGFIGTCLL